MRAALTCFARGSGPEGPRLRGRAGQPAGCIRSLERFRPSRTRSSDLGPLQQPAARTDALRQLTVVRNPRISATNGVYGRDSPGAGNRPSCRSGNEHGRSEPGMNCRFGTKSVQADLTIWCTAAPSAGRPMRHWITWIRLRPTPSVRPADHCSESPGGERPVPRDRRVSQTKARP